MNSQKKKLEIKIKHFFSFSASFAIQRMIQKKIHKSPKEQVQISFTVKADQDIPIDSITEFIIWKLNALLITSLVCDTHPINNGFNFYMISSLIEYYVYVWTGLTVNPSFWLKKKEACSVRNYVWSGMGNVFFWNRTFFPYNK